MIYIYHTARGVAMLNKGDEHKLLKLGKFKSDQEAREACKVHYAKVCKALENLNKPIPQCFFA